MHGSRGLLDLFQEIARLYPSYLAGRTTNKNDPAHSLIVSEVPNVLQNLSSGRSLLKFEGSAGKGNMTPAPWMAVYHTDITTSATDGFYVVYLLSLSMKRLVLEIGLGATQFEKRFGTGQKMLAKVEEGASLVRKASDYILPKVLSPSTLQRISSSPVQLLDGMRSPKHEAYERCSIYSLSYDLAATTDPVSFENDYKEILSLYCEMVGSPLVPEVEDLPWTDVNATAKKHTIETSLFVPLKPKTERKTGTGSGLARKYSKQSDKVGREGERIVFELEKQKLEDLGRSDLAQKVIWHRDYAKDRTPGWDITSYDESGKKIFIEVKATVANSITSIQLTSNEWETAAKPNIHDCYLIYLVTSALTDPKIEVLADPHSFVSHNKLEIAVATWVLDLREKQ
jgi:hypothetical protein